VVELSGFRTQWWGMK